MPCSASNRSYMSPCPMALCLWWVMGEQRPSRTKAGSSPGSPGRSRARGCRIPRRGTAPAACPPTASAPVPPGPAAVPATPGLPKGAKRPEKYTRPRHLHPAYAASTRGRVRRRSQAERAAHVFARSTVGLLHLLGADWDPVVSAERDEGQEGTAVPGLQKDGEAGATVPRHRRQARALWEEQEGTGASREVHHDDSGDAERQGQALLCEQRGVDAM